MQVDWVDIAITILTTGFFSLIGFVWKFSHKVTAMEKDVQAHQKRIRKMEADHDKVMDRMYSMAKERSKLMSKESYHNYEDSREMSRMVAMARYEAEQKSRGNS